PVQLPQITEINNVSNENYIPAKPNPQIQHHQATIRNYQIQPPLTPVQANIQINNLQRQPSFIFQPQMPQIIGDENCVTQNEQNEEVNVNNAIVIINNNNPQDSQNSKKLKYI
ncbi:1664_t:CDS:2, partial [Dentiscutata erythropus]